MELMPLRVFQRHVRDQCQYVLFSIAPINAGLKSGGDKDALWIAVQMFVTGAGNVSKALWGCGNQAQRAKAYVERQDLRDSLQVNDSSPLRDLAMRNHFEHFDERIEKWWEEDSTHNMLDRSVFPPHMVQGLPSNWWFRVIDPSSMKITFWDDEFSIQPIADECERVFAISNVECAKPHWDPAERRTRGGGQQQR